MLRSSRLFPFVLCGLIVLASSSFFLPFFAARAHASSGTFTQYTYNGSAGSRPYYVYTPANYQVGTPVPLIVMLHGCTQTPTDFANGTQMNTLADQDQFIVVYPQQTSTYNSLSVGTGFNPLISRAAAASRLSSRVLSRRSSRLPPNGPSIPTGSMSRACLRARQWR